MCVASGGALGMIAGALFGLFADGCGGAVAFGAYGFVAGLGVGATTGIAWYALVRLLGTGSPGGPESDYDDKPPAG